MFVRITDDTIINQDDIVEIKAFVGIDYITEENEEDTGKRDVIVTIETKDDVYPVAEFFALYNYQELIDNIIIYLIDGLNEDYTDLRVQKIDWVLFIPIK